MLLYEYSYKNTITLANGVAVFEGSPIRYNRASPMTVVAWKQGESKRILSVSHMQSIHRLVCIEKGQNDKIYLEHESHMSFNYLFRF